MARSYLLYPSGTKKFAGALMRKVSWFDGVGADLQSAARSALKDRTLTAVAAGTLALSIGLNATLSRS